MHDPSADHPPTGPRWTDAFARLVLRAPRTVLAISLALAIAGGVLGWFRLPLDANTDSLISRDRPWMKLYLSFLAEFGDLEYLYVVVDTKGDRAAGERAVDDLLAKLQAMPDLPGVYGRIEPVEQWRLASWASSDSELEGLADASDGLVALGGDGDWLAEGDAYLERIVGLGAISMSPEEQRSTAAAGLLLLDSVAAAEEVARGEAPQLDLAQERKPVYLASDTGRLLFVAIAPHKDFSTLAAIEGPMAEIRAAIDATRAKFPNLEIGLTGKPVLQADELITSTGDTTMSFAGGLALVAILCVLIYRDWRRPLLAVIAFGVAIGWTEGAAALLVGRLTLLSMVFMLVLIGAGLDYGIHVVSRYTEFRATLSIEESVRRTLHTTAVGTLTGAATSAAVFVLAIFSNFGGLRELGIIAGAGLVLCALAMVTTLPALLVLFDSARIPKVPHEIPVPLASVGLHRPHARGSLWIFAVLCLVSLVAIPLGLRFESNLLKLQADDLESVRWEKRVLADSASLSWFAAVIAADQTEARAAIERAKQQPEIGFIRSAFDLVRPDSAERLAWRERVTTAPHGSPLRLPPARPWTADRLRAAALRVNALATLATGRSATTEVAHLRLLADRLSAAATHPAEPAALDAAKARISDAAEAIVAGAKASLRDALPAAVRAKFVSPNGKLLVQLIPKGDTWEFEPLLQFVDAIRRVAPDATGVPITQSESIKDMYRAFVTISLWSVLAVALIVWLDFRTMAAVVLCTSVLLVGILLTLGFMALVGVPLSLANFFGIPILIGLGIDSNIHLLHRAQETHSDDRPEVEFGGTRSAVVFTALTTAIGFGGQLFASHRGMQGLGWIIVVGSLVCLATSMWLLPAVLRLSRR